MPGAEANIEGNQIVIRIDIDTLPIAVEGGIELGYINPGSRIVDAQAFAKDVVYHLNYQEEDGTNLISEMFDQAFDDALDMGAQGAEYEGIDYGIEEDE